jgi:hypothetical protein
MKAAARVASKPAQPKRAKPVATPEKIDPEIAEILADPQMILAIKYLEPLLNPEEKLKYRRVLEHESTSSLRAQAWRERRDHDNMERVRQSG